MTSESESAFCRSTRGTEQKTFLPVKGSSPECRICKCVAEWRLDFTGSVACSLMPGDCTPFLSLTHSHSSPLPSPSPPFPYVATRTRCMMSPLNDPILLSSSVQRAGQVTLTLSRTLTLTASESTQSITQRGFTSHLLTRVTSPLAQRSTNRLSTPHG